MHREWARLTYRKGGKEKHADGDRECRWGERAEFLTRAGKMTFEYRTIS